MSRAASVLVMSRAPRPGHTKTRLQPLLGAHGCARLQTALITHTATIAAAAAPGSVFVAVDPAGALREVADLIDPTLTAMRVFAQQGGSLGDRMHAALTYTARARPGPVVLIGTDVPHLNAAHIRTAVHMLECGDDVVFGPAADGGYYLIAVNRPNPAVFAIDPALWGGPRVLEASVAAARDAGLHIGFLPILEDLDTAEDARALIDDDTVPLAIRSLLGNPAPDSVRSTCETSDAATGAQA